MTIDAHEFHAEARRLEPAAQAHGRLAFELAALTGALRSDELIYCFDPSPLDPGNWAQVDHCDHIHAGYDS